MKEFNATITKLDGVLFEGPVVSLTAPAETGEMTVLSNHMPVISTLKEGKIRIKLKESSQGTVDNEFDILSGVLEFSDNTVNILIFE